LIASSERRLRRADPTGELESELARFVVVAGSPWCPPTGNFKASV
jgi:hypothetical protein